VWAGQTQGRIGWVVIANISCSNSKAKLVTTASFGKVKFGPEWCCNVEVCWALVGL